MSGAGPLISTDRVSKVYNPRRPDAVRAVHEVTLEIQRGDVVVLQGPSGSGKTSLLSLVGCMSRPTSGRVHVAGDDVTRLSEQALTEVRRRRFGFIFQQFHLVPDLSVLDNVVLPLYAVPMSFAAMRRRGERILERLGMGPATRRMVRQLSGGEQQRVAVARALVNEPDAVIADEPTAHLDRELSMELLTMLSELNRSGATVIVATHDPLVVEHPMVDTVVAMRDGSVVDGDRT
jgi:putative ABC transport system ATP-binding protein